MNIIKALKNMQGKAPTELDKDSLELFNAIMKIVDERDELQNRINKIVKYAKYNLFSDEYNDIKKMSRGEDIWVI